MAKVLHKDVGDLWSEPQFTFTVNGAETDPTNLTVKQQAPDGTETILLNNVLVSTLTGSSTPIKKVSTGVFQPNPGIDLTASGHWFLRAAGTGAVTAAEEHEVIVDPSQFTGDAGVSTRALVSVSEAKDYLRARSVDTTDDLELVARINSVSQRIHQEAEREFKVSGTNPQARTIPIEILPRREPFYIDGEFVGYGPAARNVDIGDLTSATLVEIISSDWTTVLATVTSYTLHPMVKQPWEPYTRIELGQTVTGLNVGYRVRITGNWGFPSVPDDIKQATLEGVAAAYDVDATHWRQDLAPGVDTPEGGTMILIGGSQRILSLPPSALATAWSYRTLAVR